LQLLRYSHNRHLRTLPPPSFPTRRSSDLSLISDILDLAKIESGTVTLDFGPLRLTDLKDYVERTFRPTALEQKLDFSVSIDPGLDRKSTRLNSSHGSISYAVFCLKKENTS